MKKGYLPEALGEDYSPTLPQNFPTERIPSTISLKPIYVYSVSKNPINSLIQTES